MYVDETDYPYFASIYMVKGSVKMNSLRPRMTYLFEQLGLDAEQVAIVQFIEQHQLAADIDILQADFWSVAQRAFLEEKIGSDGEWAIVIDQLNESLHEDSLKSLKQV